MTTRSTRSPRRRTVVALAVVLAVLSGFVVRLVDIQVVNADQHIEDSMELSLGSAQKLYGARGEIVDDEGQTLAGSILLYDGVLSPMNVAPIKKEVDGKTVTTSVADQAAQMAAITGQTADEIEQIITDALAENPNSQFAYLAQSLTTEQYRALADLGYSYLTFSPHPSRTYPDGAVGGNLVGFVGSDGAALAGLEKTEDSCLASEDGEVLYQKGADGVVIPGTETETAAVDGGTLKLTINRDLEWYMQQLIAEQTQNMGAQSGTITVVDVKTGQIKAAAEYPTVDPNDIEASSSDDWYSRIFKDTFEPGSTFKPLTAASLLDSGAATMETTVSASSLEYFADGARVRDAFVHPAYNYHLTGVLVDSSNAGISKFAELESAETRYDYLKKFGIGIGSAIGFSGEQSGLIYPADEWGTQTFYNTAFGQGLTTTVPELVGAYQAIANDGVKIPLSLVDSCTSADGTVTKPDTSDTTQVISSETAEDVQQMMENVAIQGDLSDQVQVPGYRIAFKTGTGEKSDGNGGYKAGVYFTTMIGFAPADDPQYVVAVTLDEPTKVTSSAATAPAFQKAMTQVLKTFRVMPSDTQPTILSKFG
ncbi:cell division protein FtsI (penicillin-binding protein 3) [Microbacterium halimionae]|uniref:Cell division protein FtsI (Penicillin-binding protein 3) n=1 Tax=Microbacterium halimionae TaxID=1526413 RepID=A0A7W3JNW1_9MICO|nr:penicillin-binding protein 2 [Microbacterium halimionae]MBA8816317.1 cell division protein FtsI (penicillin-binding protein 3) [Microbacterium halimionae]NII96520.1 cell division protein FtsI (penicillin-binding protein 3) [Microbacterium halimionae]